MFIISPDLGNELFRSSHPSPPCHETTRRREFVYFDVKMIWLTDRLLILSKAESVLATFVRRQHSFSAISL